LNNPRDALKHFNAARRDIKWSSQALLAMAEIYLNPENNISWASEGGEADGSQSSAAAAVDAETQEAIKAASTLLQQLRPADMESNKYKVGLGWCSFSWGRGGLPRGWVRPGAMEGDGNAFVIRSPLPAQQTTTRWAWGAGE
jgi:hypothetical protein